MGVECKRDLSYLTHLPGASQIFQADLNQPHSFNEAIQGCTAVFHLAHPMDTDQAKEPEETVTRRAVEGTVGILKACLENKKTLKRVVYTSSGAATILYNDKGLSVSDENTWSELDVCRSSKLVSPSYLVSKTVVEKMALEFAENNGLDLVTLVLPPSCWTLHLSQYSFISLHFTGHDTWYNTLLLSMFWLVYLT